jgi:hypothetical protein
VEKPSDYTMIHAGPSGGYRIDCPACHASQAGNIREWPPHFAHPFGFVCACSHFFQVFVNVRSHYRKPCQLWGEYRLKQQGRQIEGLCTVLDISQAGARVEANHLTNIELGGLLQLVVSLDDASHSRALLSGKIRWIMTRHKRVMMGIRFENLDAHSQQKLGFYVL